MWKTEQMFTQKHITFLLRKARTRGEFVVLEILDFQSPKGGNVRKNVCPPIIKAKEVTYVGRAKKQNRKNKRGLFYSVCFVSLLR